MEPDRVREVTMAILPCPKCKGTGWYQYTTRGTPHSKKCEFCCKHAGWWEISGGYQGFRPGKTTMVCKDGCGATQHKLEELAEEKRRLYDLVT